MFAIAHARVVAAEPEAQHGLWPGDNLEKGIGEDSSGDGLRKFGVESVALVKLQVVLDELSRLARRYAPVDEGSVLKPHAHLAQKLWSKHIRNAEDHVLA